MQNIYPHRLSRKGYAGLAETIKHELSDDKEVDRDILWKRARLNKEDEYEGKELVETVYKIRVKMGDSPEESSWSFYIQGFICDNKDEEEDAESPSLVSDAASYSAVIKLGHNNNNNYAKQNSFKKQKSTKVDYDLEDTASSPVNSPKVKRNSLGKAGAGAGAGAGAVEKDTNYSTALEKKTIK
ncbi:hypothetical protein ACS0TY_032773 [Phlomoides rotata]